MKSLLCFLLAALSVQAEPLKREFQPLFNGSDLSGWWGLGTEDPGKWMQLPADQLAEKKKRSLQDIQKHWKVVDGTLLNDGKGLFLTTEKHYSDFELRLEYKHGPKADSGIYLRGIPQVQIWDPNGPHPDAGKGSGGLWNNPKDSPGRLPLVVADKPLGEWNKLHIRMVGDRVTVRLNGTLVVDNAVLQNYFKKGEKLPKSGPIQLQTHGAPITWRNIEIKEL